MENHLPGTSKAIGGCRWRDRRSRTRDRHADDRSARVQAGTSAKSEPPGRSSTRTIARIDEGRNGIATAVRKSTSGHHRRPVSGDFGQWLRVPQSRQDVAARVAGRGREAGRETGHAKIFNPPFTSPLADPVNWPWNRYARHEVLYLNWPDFKAAAADFLASRRDARVGRWLHGIKAALVIRRHLNP